MNLLLKIAFRNEGDVILLLDGSSSSVGAHHAASLQGNQSSALAREFSSS